MDDAHSGRQSAGHDLTCQWCSVRLPAGETRCPTCGSPGIPDPTLTAPGIEILEPIEVAEPVKPPEELEEWWLEDEQSGTGTLPIVRSPETFEDRLLKTVGLLAGCGAVFAFIGWLIGPVFLAPAMESITGTPVENPGDLRTMGATAGLLIGLFFGASIGWIFQGER